MSVTGKACAIIPVLALFIVAAFIGCGPDRTGTAIPNQPPEVYMVNTPPDGAQFSRNPDLNWYATDIDGFVAFFRHAVVLDSMVKINGEKVTIEEFIAQATDLQFGWDTLHVDLDHPQATATIRLYANVDFPVDSFVNQYFFIQAQDDQGANSEIVWRRYSRNNNYPNTHFRTSDIPFINSKGEDDPAPGITMTWDGADSLDWGRAKPPLEFEWRLYGPFDQNAPIYVYEVPEDCVWNPDSQKYVNCINRMVLDLDALPEAVSGVPQPLRHSEGLNYDLDPTDVWVTDEQTSIYNVFKDIPTLTETTQFKFVFWVRARDDGFVPDPTPSFSQFYVLEALFERDVAAFDETNYRISSGRWFPENEDDLHVEYSKGIYYDYINNALEEVRGADYTPFDTANISDTLTYPVGTRTDYFCVFRPEGPPGLTAPIIPTMVDLLSHKVLVCFNDDAEGGAQEDPAFGLLGHVFLGMNMGASGWLMCRNLADKDYFFPGATWDLSPQMAQLFGMESTYHEGWTYWSLGRATDPDPTTIPIWNEQFVGAVPVPELTDVFPEIDIVPEYLNNRYSFLDANIFFPIVPPFVEHPLEALPEVGTCTRTSSASPVYLYKSIHGDASNLHGQVLGVVQSLENLRSAAFLFTPMATDPEQTHELFVTVLNFLLEPFEQEAAFKTSVTSLGQGNILSVEQRRQNIQDYMDRLAEAALEDPEILTNMGIDLAPYIVHDNPNGQ